MLHQLMILLFSGCTGLTSIEIPNSVISIGNNAFSGCTGLTSIIIPGLVTLIGEYAFYRCSSLTLVIIPEKVTSIGEYVFYRCSKNLIFYTNINSNPEIYEILYSYSNNILPESEYKN